MDIVIIGSQYRVLEYGEPKTSWRFIGLDWPSTPDSKAEWEKLCAEHPDTFKMDYRDFYAKEDGLSAGNGPSDAETISTLKRQIKHLAHYAESRNAKIKELEEDISKLRGDLFQAGQIWNYWAEQQR